MSQKVTPLPCIYFRNKTATLLSKHGTFWKLTVSLVSMNQQYEQQWKKATLLDGFGGLVVSILATGNRDRVFKPGRSRWIFRASGKSSVCLPSEGKYNNMSHVPALRHVKEPSGFS